MSPENSCQWNSSVEFRECTIVKEKEFRKVDKIIQNNKGVSGIIFNNDTLTKEA